MPCHGLGKLRHAKATLHHITSLKRSRDLNSGFLSTEVEAWLASTFPPRCPYEGLKLLMQASTAERDTELVHPSDRGQLWLPIAWSGLEHAQHLGHLAQVCCQGQDSKCLPKGSHKLLVHYSVSEEKGKSAPRRDRQFFLSQGCRGLQQAKPQSILDARGKENFLNPPNRARTHPGNTTHTNPPPFPLLQEAKHYKHLFLSLPAIRDRGCALLQADHAPHCVHTQALGSSSYR